MERLRQRARLYKKIRAFFDELDYLEVDTPLLGVSTNTDYHIQSIEASLMGHQRFLQTSPEFAMKRLLVENRCSLYQICHAFRDEERGRFHHPEFSLLEWYNVGSDYMQLMQQVETLLNQILEKPSEFVKASYFDLFEEHLDLRISEGNTALYRQRVKENIPGIDIHTLQQDDCLDLLMNAVIAKTFKGYTFVYDYPATQASLARLIPTDPLKAERFELFYNDLELANGFSELTDATEQRRRFEQDNARRRNHGQMIYPLDEDFLNALESGLPACAGVALGLDRLLMVQLQSDRLQSVLSLDTLGLPTAL